MTGNGIYANDGRVLWTVREGDQVQRVSHQRVAVIEANGCRRVFDLVKGEQVSWEPKPRG